MNILIEVSYNKYVTVPAEHAAAMLALIPHIRTVEESGYGETTAYKVDELPPKLTFIDSAKLAPLSQADAALQRAFEAKNTEWANAYTKNAANEKRVAELERQLAAQQAAA